MIRNTPSKYWKRWRTSKENLRFGHRIPAWARRGDEARRSGRGPDSRTPEPEMHKLGDMYVPDVHIDTTKLKSWNFR